MNRKINIIFIIVHYTAVVSYIGKNLFNNNYNENYNTIDF